MAAKGSFGTARLTAIGVVLAASAVVGWESWVRTPRIVEGSVGNRPIQVPGNGYASSTTCQACHPSEYASWHASYHRTMTQVATPDSVIANFDGAQVNEVPGHPMRLERRANELWAELDDPDWNGQGDRPPRVTRQVVMTTGSHNQQIYWYATGKTRTLGQLPAIQLVSEHRWIPRRAAVMHPPGQAIYAETGSWNGICVACHTTLGRPEFDTPFGTQPIQAQHVDTQAVEFGISCEACHGPGDAHAELNRSPWRRYWMHLKRAADPSIVQPLRLDPRRASEVCGQCHGFWEFYDQQGERQANSQGLPYRPGDELTATRFIIQPTRNLDAPTMKTLLGDDPEMVRDMFWSDGMVRATGREYNGLIESPCFKNARDDARTMTCFSCHSMHADGTDARGLAQWAVGQLTPAAAGNDACLTCHPALGQNVTAHTRHRADSSGSACLNCHMPYTTYGLLKTIRSHQISSPTVAATIETGRPNACNLCHLDKTLGWTSTYLTQWYGAAAPPLGDDDRSVAAALITLLKGDAGQRAIVAQSMGWEPAQQASGANWLGPYLALLLDDPYDAVRYITARSLKTLPGFAGFVFDFVAPERARAASRIAALDTWRRANPPRTRRTDPSLLINADGTFNAAVVDRLLRERNNRRVVYRE